MSKTININPDLFKVSGNTSRKKLDPEKKIRVKTKENKTTKRALLQFIRAKQNDYMKNKENDYMKDDTPAETERFNSDFDESMKYLKHLSEQPEQPEKHNHTIRNYGEFPYTASEKPQYGCLKGGSLPTSRNWKNVTQKAKPVEPVPNSYNIPSRSETVQKPLQKPLHEPLHEPLREPAQQDAISEVRKELGQMISEMKQSKEYTDNVDKIRSNKVRYPKQKRTSRRTYLLGKSKTFPKVSVLVSNRTIRNKISTQKQLIKQTPLPEIKKYLIKHGFIKIGTTAPNDVLRKMYETAILMCGEIHNHNPDNLLYNFFYKE